MKSFKSIREGNSVEPGVSEIDDVQDDPLSFVEIKPKKTKVVKEDLQEAVSVKKEKHSWGTIMTVHHGSDTSYPLHPEHQSAIKKLRPGMKTTFKDETNSTVHAHREGDTVHLTRPKTGSTLTSLPYHHFDTSDHAKPAAKKPAGEYDRKVTDHLKKKYNEEAELEEGIKSKIAGVALSALAAHGAALGHERRVTPDGQGGFTGGLKPSPTVTAPASAPAAEAPKGFSREYLQGVVDGKHPRPLLSKEKAAEHLKNMKEEAEQMDELNRDTVTSYAARAEKDVNKKHKDLTAQIKSNNPLSANKTADKIIKRYSGMDRAENRLNKEETVVETKGAPKGFHFTKDGKLKRGDADQDGNGGPMLRTDPLDKQRNKVPAVSERVEQMDEKLTSKDIKMAVGVAKDKRYAGGNMSGAVKTMEKMKPGLSKHPRVQQVLKSTNEGIDFLKLWNGIKPVHEEVKTTHEDPLVLTKDAEGHIHTHANLSVANAIHGTNVKHQAIHTGKPVQAGKFTFELSKHHEGALKEDAPFDAVAHKKELDQLMGKHMAAHTQTTKLINAKAPQEQINKAQERNNAVKAEIRAHKDKVPKGPAPKPGSAADYYASKKPGEYTGD